MVGIWSDSNMIMELRDRTYIDEDRSMTGICGRTYLTIMIVDQIVRHEDMNVST